MFLSSYRKKGTCGKCGFQNVVNVETKVLTPSHLYSRSCTEINDSNLAGRTKSVVNVEAKITASHLYGRSSLRSMIQTQSMTLRMQ